MSVWEKSRFRIFNRGQHPYNHDLSEFFYGNARLPGISTAGDALDYVIAAIYPDYKGTVATPAALPLGASPNDFYVVNDDGDGKSAGYVWSVIDNAGTWIKRYDVDWTFESILGEAVNRTQYMYVHKYGFTDHDDSGAPLVGLRAGQTVYGGDQTLQNLTLNANSIDATGFVQTDNTFRPTADGTLELGQTALRWLKVWTGTLTAGNLTLGSGSIVDSGGAISFGANNLSTSGDIYSGGTVQAVTELIVGAPVAPVAIVWSSLTNMTALGSQLTDTAGGAWAAFASSNQVINGVGYVDFTTAAGIHTMVGLSDNISVIPGSTFSAIRYAAYNAAGTLHVYESGVDQGIFGAVAPGDVLRVESDGTTVTYKLNGAVFYTSLLSALGLTLHPVCSAFSGGVVVNTATVVASIDQIQIQPGSIVGTLGLINFGSTALKTTGTLASGTVTVSSDLVLATGSITSASGAISFGNENLTTTGTLAAGNTTVPQIDAGNLRITGNTISAQNLNGDINLTANGLGLVILNSDASTQNIQATGFITASTFMDAGTLRLTSNLIQAIDVNGSIRILPDGTGQIELSSTTYPTTDGAQDLGKGGQLWQKLWISGSIGGATEILISELVSLRNVLFRDAARTQAVQAGDTVFWDAVSGTWLANHPDTEITHSELTGLTTGDAGHTQFVMLAGRAGGQSVQGGTAASENLVLESTAHATKGFVIFKDTLIPFANASFAVSWSGLDLGDGTHYIRDVYSKGEFRGFRLENFTSTTLPATSAANAGHLVFATDNDKLYIDTGGSWLVASYAKFLSDTAWNGVQTTQTFVVSSTIEDARKAIWAIHDNTNDFEVIYAKIEAISATQVRVTVAPALPAGSYRLIGLE